MLGRYTIYRGKRVAGRELPAGVRQDTRKHTRHCLRPEAAAVRAYLADPSDRAFRRFAAAYERVLSARFEADRRPFDALAELARVEDVHLGCSCPTKKNPVERCHTMLALRFMRRRYADLEIAEHEEPGMVIDADVAEAYDAFEPAVRRALLTLRGLILQTAARMEDLGGIAESLKWGQPSYATRRSNVGSTVRLGGVPGKPNQYALYVHCQSALVPAFRRLYPDVLRFGGNRSILLSVGEALPTRELTHCIELALTYHRWKSDPDRPPKVTARSRR